MRTKSIPVHGYMLEASCDEAVPEVDLDLILDYFHSTFATAPIPVDPKVIQVGMMLIKAVETESGCLILCEPDMMQMPIIYVSDMTRTLRILRLQKDTFESVDIRADLLFPDILQTILQCRDWPDAGSYIMERSAPRGNDTGWYIGCQNPEHDHQNPENLSLMSVYELAINYPEVIPFLAFPVGATILVENGHPFIYMDGEEKPPNPGSFLSRYLARKAKGL